MLRKNIRLRKEYLYKKSKESQENAMYEKKRKIREALENKKRIPTEIKKDEKEKLMHEIEMEDEISKLPFSHIDDEYALAKYQDPKVIITSSRDPSQRLLQFIKEVRLLIPNSKRMNRGNTVIKDLVQLCHDHSFTDLIIVHEHKGEPDGMILSHFPFGPTICFGIANVILRHDIQGKVDPMSEVYPHLILHNFTTTLGKRLAEVIKHLFPMPKVDSKRVLTFANQNDYIVFRHHNYEKEGEEKVKILEVGPRFDLKPFQITLGTLDQIEAPVEWVLRPYMNTAKRRKAF